MWAAAAAAEGTHFELGIWITSPTSMRLGLLICVLTNWICSRVTFAAVAMLARSSPEMTVWLETMLQFVPTAVVLFCAVMGTITVAAMKRKHDEKCIVCGTEN